MGTKPPTGTGLIGQAGVSPGEMLRGHDNWYMRTFDLLLLLTLVIAAVSILRRIF